MKSLDEHGVEQILVTGHHHSNSNKRNANVNEEFTMVSCKRSRLHTETYLKEKDISFCKQNGPLGLKLEKSPSFINSIQVKLTEIAKKKAAQDSKMDHDKLKASNFGALHLIIGTWERVCKHEGDLIAKCYYAKKKIVWEILEGALKRKIEIQWSDIIGINAIIRDDDEPGVLEIELGNPPTYFLETNPQPRKHTLWQTATDFTGGQAPSYRRHLITFPPGILDKHYEKLLQCDQRLFNLSQKPFPTLSSPYFISNNVYGLSEYPYYNLNRNANEIPPQMHQCHVQKFPMPSGHVHHVQNTKTTTNTHRPFYFVDSIAQGVARQLQYAPTFGAPAGLPCHSQSLHTPKPHTVNMDLSSAILDERATTSHMIENQRSVFLDQGTNYTSQGSSHILYQNFNGEESGIGNTPTNISELKFVETADNQILLDDINSLIELGGISPDIAAKQLDQCFLTNHAGLEHAVNQNCVANGSTLMIQPRNQSLYQYHVQEPTEQNVETLNTTLMHRWG